MSFLPTDPQNIIVRMPNWIGDAVMATPVLADLRVKWPNAKITAMCQSHIADLLENDPNIDEIFLFRKISGWVHLAHRPDIVEPLKNGQYDLGILLTNSLSSAWWFWLGNVKNRIGFGGNLRSILLNKAQPFPSNKEKQHLVLTYKALLESIDIPISARKPRLYVTQEEYRSAEKMLADHGVFVGKQIILGINPGAAYGSAKCWPPDRFQKVSQKLLENPNLSIVYFGDAAGLWLINDICKELPSERVINLAGKTTLRELMALIGSCSLFLTNDSGPMHIAAALQIPLLALFGSTSEIKTGPYETGKVIHKHVECSPCYKRTCPIDFRCMKRIESEEVYNELQKLITEFKINV